jgi:hypothetical protein
VLLLDALRPLATPAALELLAACAAPRALAARDVARLQAALAGPPRASVPELAAAPARAAAAERAACPAPDHHAEVPSAARAARALAPAASEARCLGGRARASSRDGLGAGAGAGGGLRVGEVMGRRSGQVEGMRAELARLRAALQPGPPRFDPEPHEFQCAPAPQRAPSLTLCGTS